MGFLTAEDEALKASLRNIFVSDEKNQAREVGVWFANPDVESRQQSYPYLTIELLDIEWAANRQHSGILVDNDSQGSVAPLANRVHTYEMPVPWNLTYQITSYARHPRHDRRIIAHLLSNDFPAQRGFLSVQNDLETESSFRHLILQGFTKRDTIEDGRRLFRNVFTITVTSETVAGDGVGIPEAVNILINNQPTSISDDFTIL